MNEEIPTGWINQKTAAASCGITVVGFQKWKVPPIGKVGRNTYYTIAGILESRLANQRRLVSKTDGDGEETDYGKEKARLTREQADAAARCLSLGPRPDVVHSAVPGKGHPRGWRHSR